jgi:hypothetical protein
MNQTTMELSKLAWLIEHNRWLGVLSHARHMVAVSGSGLRHKFGSALVRVETRFHQLFKTHPWPSDWLPSRLAENQNLILWYIREFGDASPLLADMMAVYNRSLKPRSLAYFLVAEKGKRASRWELLLNDKIQADWQAVKADEARWAADHQSTIDNRQSSIDNRQSTIDNPLNQIIIRSARADFTAAVKNCDVREASKIRNKIFALYRVDLAADHPPSDILKFGNSGIPESPNPGIPESLNPSSCPS